MTDEPKPPFPGWPGGWTRVIADANVGEDENSGGGNRVFRPEEFEAAFGRHPWADFKPVIRSKRKRR